MTTRREFLVAGGALATAGRALPPIRGRAAHDIVFRRGTVIDGSGTPGVIADVAISGSRISAIGPGIAGRGREEFDARGRVVAPGFVDIHSHGDESLDADPRAESLIRQGVTTIVVGQDGSSRGAGPAADAFANYLRQVDAWQPAVNVAAMIGLGSVRGAVVGNADRPATPTELVRMTAAVTAAIDAGACGASSGLEYTPGAFASREELIALARPLAARGLVYASHMRNEDDRLLEALDEAIAVAAGAGCRLQVSHLKTQGPRNWDKLDAAFARIDAAAATGLDIAFDRYPYVAYSTGLSNLFPVWSRDGGTDAFFARLDGGDTATRIREATLAKVESIGGWDHVMITGVRDAADRALEGQRLGTAAARTAVDPYAFAVALLQRNRAAVGMVGFAMSEENLERILAHPLAMVCSDGGAIATDGPARRGHPHPRGIGAFARVLGHYVRERRALTLEAAVRRMSAMPASRASLADRGRLVVGAPADVVMFDPDTVRDRATFEDPFQYAEGIDVVTVAGEVALAAGERRGSGKGRALRATHRRQ
ncbi:MAG: amidohydrolase family protein [Gemmatimonadales bacterium]|nr:amidohydrolase family protein [Gemmatimonadales bacterium]